MISLDSKIIKKNLIYEVAKPTSKYFSLKAYLSVIIFFVYHAKSMTNWESSKQDISLYANN